jgi:hypothetical protein
MIAEISQQHLSLLLDLAKQYIWWMPPEEAARYPQQVVAQVMNIGLFRDMNRLAEEMGDDCLREAIYNAEAGQFNERSWHYWHYRLRLSGVGQVPPLPARFIPPQ